jgi:hypothetical protein
MSRFERWLLWVSTALVALSGIGFAVLKYLVVSDDPYAVVNHPWQPFFLKLHVLSAPALVFGVGVVFMKHIWKQWRSDGPVGRRTGVLVFALLAPMVVSGYAIQVATHRSFVWWLVAVHLVSGSGYLLAIAGHQIRALVLAPIDRRGGEPSVAGGAARDARSAGAAVVKAPPRP